MASVFRVAVFAALMFTLAHGKTMSSKEHLISKEYVVVNADGSTGHSRTSSFSPPSAMRREVSTSTVSSSEPALALAVNSSAKGDELVDDEQSAASPSDKKGDGLVDDEQSEASSSGKKGDELDDDEQSEASPSRKKGDDLDDDEQSEASASGMKGDELVGDEQSEASPSSGLGNDRSRSSVQDNASSGAVFRRRRSSGADVPRGGTATTLKVLTLNLACRDVDPFSACDNCQTRFNLIAKAFEGEAGFSGLPALATVDVVIAQELGTTSDKFSQISDALFKKGFVHTTGEPLPRTLSKTCARAPFVGVITRLAGSLYSGLKSGGLVTWSRYPIAETVSHNWCAHGLPVPAGYLVTLLHVGNGRMAAVINLHAMPEYNFGFDDFAESVRTYQFGELSGLAKKLKESFVAASVPYSIILGGDFNEDTYSFEDDHNDDTGRACELIVSNLVRKKYASVGLDVKAACEAKKIGEPTWDPTKNDLTEKFTKANLHEALDFLIEYSSSHASGVANNSVSIFKKDAPWHGQFCDDPSSSSGSEIHNKTATGLTDHNIVTAVFSLPTAVTLDANTLQKKVSDGKEKFLAGINQFMSPTPGLVDDFSCGQENSRCFNRADCCKTQYSPIFPQYPPSAKKLECDKSGFGIQLLGTCKACVTSGESCGWRTVGSECCDYDDFTTSGDGLFCTLPPLLIPWARSFCSPKHHTGNDCVFNADCRSNRCHWKTTCWGWLCSKKRKCAS